MILEDIEVDHNIITIVHDNISYTIHREKLGEDYIVHTIELPLSELHKNDSESYLNSPDLYEWMTSRIGPSQADFKWYIIGDVLLSVLQVDSIEEINKLPVKTIYYKEADNLFIFIERGKIC